MKKLNKKFWLSLVGSSVALSTVAATAVACSSTSSSTANVDVTSLNSYWRSPAEDDAPAFTSVLKTFHDDGKRAFVLPGFNQGGKLEIEMANQGLWNNSIALVLDAFYNEANQYNLVLNGDRVAAVYFKVDEAAFLAGIAAAYMLNSHQSTFNAETDGLKWGGYVGIDARNTTNFLAGFSLGVKWANEKLKGQQIKQDNSEVTKTWVEVQEVQATDSAVGGFDANSEKARQVVNSLITKGADLLLPVAGPQTHISVSTAASSDRNIMVIGVDTPQENIVDLNRNTTKFANVNFDSGINKQGVIPFSITKNLHVATARLLENAIKNEGFAQIQASAQVITPVVKGSADVIGETKYAGRLLNDADKYKLGTNTVGGIADGVVGLSEAGHSYLIKAYNQATPSLLSNPLTSYDQVVNAILNDSTFKLLNKELNIDDRFVEEVIKTKNGDVKLLYLKDKTKGVNHSVNGGTLYEAAELNRKDQRQVYYYPVLKSTYIAESPSNVFKQVWDEAQKKDKEANDGKWVNSLNLVAQILSFKGLQLKDKSFSQTTFEGIIKFFTDKGINIKEIINWIP